MNDESSSPSEYLRDIIGRRAEGFGDIPIYNIVVEEGSIMGADMELHEVTDDHGSFYGDYGVSKEAPEEVKDRVEGFVREFDAEIGACFHNALRVFEEVEGAVYVEGHALNGTGVFHHAWNLVDGHVVDTTLSGKAYYGVRVDDETAGRCAQLGHEENVWGVFTNYADNHRFLTESGYQ